jgi:cytochrome c oxidase subunit 2
MRGEIVVETQAEYDAWMATKKPKYFAAFPDKDPSAKQPTAAPAATVDSAAKQPIAQAK